MRGDDGRVLVSLVKVSVLNGMATALRLATTVALNKVLAVHLGPAGYSLLGQFSNVVMVANSVAGGAISNGIVKYTAESVGDDARQRAVWRAAAMYTAVCAAVAAALLLVFRKELAYGLLGNVSYAPVFAMLAVALPLVGFNGLLLAIMNGRKEVRSYVIQNMLASLAGALLSGALAVGYGVMGALAALAVNQAVVLVVTLWLCRRAPWLSRDAFIGAVDPHLVRFLLGFALMALVSALAGPLSQMSVRETLMRRFGATAAGEWQAVFKISEIYLTLFTTTLTVYYLPRLSEIRDNAVLVQEIRRVYSFVLPATVAAAAGIYWLRDWITVMLFSVQFAGMRDLFAWQLVGDVLKVGSWILAFVMVGRAMVRWFVVTEILFSVSWVLLSEWLMQSMGPRGAVAAFACNYALYWLFMAWLMRFEMKRSTQ